MSPEYPDPEKYELPTAEDLRRMRLLCDLTLSEVAENVERSGSAIKNYENGDSSPRLEDVEDLLDVYAEELPEPRPDGGPPQFQDDPHDVVPTTFWYFYRSLKQAIKNMETDTKDDEKPRCPECESTHLTPLSGKACANTGENDRWKCKRCTAYFRDPLPPEADTRQKVRA